MTPHPAMDCSRADSISDLSTNSEEERLKEFAKTMYFQLNPIERNPSMTSKRTSGTNEALVEQVSLFRRSSRMGSSSELTMTQRRGSSGECTARMGSGRKSLGIAVRKSVQRNVRKIKGEKVTKFANDKHLTDYQFIETCQELEADLIAAIWFSRDELAYAKDDADRLAEALEVQYQSNPEELVNHEDWRGLESRSEDGNWNSYKARLDVTNAVLDAQDGIKAPRGLRRPSATEAALLMAQASREVSVTFAEEAVERASRDAILAKEYCRDVHSHVQTQCLEQSLPLAKVEQPPPKTCKKETQGSRRRLLRLSSRNS